MGLKLKVRAQEERFEFRFRESIDRESRFVDIDSVVGLIFIAHTVSEINGSCTATEPPERPVLSRLYRG